MRAIILQASFAIYAAVAVTDQNILQQGVDVGNTAVQYLDNAVYQLRGGRIGKLCADEDNRIKCNRNGIGKWEKFTFQHQGGDWWALKGGKNGKWCQDDGREMKCRANRVQGWEKFRLSRSGTHYALTSGKSHRFCADEGNRIICNRGARGSWEKFYIAHDLSALRKSGHSCVWFNKAEIPLPKMFRDAVDAMGTYSEVEFQACTGRRRRVSSSIGGTVKHFFSAWKIDGYWDYYNQNTFRGPVRGRMQICYLYWIRPIKEMWLEIPLIASGMSYPSFTIYLCLDGKVIDDGKEVHMTVVLDGEFHEGGNMGGFKAAVQGKIVTGGVKLSGSFSLKNFKVVGQPLRPQWSDTKVNDAKYEAFLTYGDQRFVNVRGQCLQDAKGAAQWTATLFYDEVVNPAFDSATAAATEANKVGAEIRTNAESAMLVAESLGKQVPQNEAEREKLANDVSNSVSNTAQAVATEVKNDPQGAANKAANAGKSAAKTVYNAGNAAYNAVFR